MGGHGPFPLRLKLLDEVGRAAAAGDDKAGPADPEDRARRSRTGRQGSLGRVQGATPEDVRPSFPEKGENARASARARTFLSMAPAVSVQRDAAVLFADLRGERGLGIILLEAGRSRRYAARVETRRLAPRAASRVSRAGAVSRGPTGTRLLGQDIALVHPVVELDDGHARLGVAVEDGPLDRGRAAVFRQEREVDVEGMVAGEIVEVVGDDLAVGDDDVDVGPRPPGPARGLPRPSGCAAGSMTGRPRSRAKDLTGEGVELAAASGRLVGLGDDELDRVARFEQGREGGEGRGRAPEEDDPHAVLAAAAFFLSFFLISARFRAESFSTKRMPSRWSISWQKARASRSSPSISTARPSRSRPADDDPVGPGDFFLDLGDR